MTQHPPEQAGGPEMTLAAVADGRYVKAVGASSGLIDTVPGCKGLSVDLDALWDEVSRLEADGDQEGVE